MSTGHAPGPDSGANNEEERMSEGLHIWLDSGANIHSKHEQTLTWDELGHTEEEWDEMTEDEQTEVAKEIAFNYADWGFEKV